MCLCLYPLLLLHQHLPHLACLLLQATHANTLTQSSKRTVKCNISSYHFAGMIKSLLAHSVKGIQELGFECAEHLLSQHFPKAQHSILSPFPTLLHCDPCAVLVEH